MPLEPRVCRQLMKEVRGCFGVPSALFDLNGALLSYTDRESLPSLLGMQKRIASGLLPAAYYDALYGPLRGENGLDCCRILLTSSSAHPEYIGWVQLLLNMCLTNQALADKQYTLSNDRLSFVYQLLSSSVPGSDSVSSRAVKLKFDPNVPRCTLVFELFDSGTNLDPANNEALHQSFVQAVRDAPGFDANDFGDFLTESTFVLFKTANAAVPRKGFLENYVRSVLTDLSPAQFGSVRVGIGTFYQDLCAMHSSYQEAQFVLKNSSVLCPKEVVCFAEDYVFDYLMSTLPIEQQKKRFDPLAETLSSTSFLTDTLKAIVAQDCNLSGAAQLLGIHRNTMLQRYARLTETCGIDPIHSDSDRILARQCAVYLNRKTVFHAGIIIQNTSDLHWGCRHFARQLEKHSGGTMTVEVLNVGLSGNNRSLLDLLLNKTLDFIVVDIDTVVPLAGDSLTVCNLPHIFTDYEDAYQLLTGAVGQELLRPLEKGGVIGLGFWTMGWRYFSTRDEPIRTPEQLQALRVRTMSKQLIIDYLRRLGAEPIPISYDNILHALSENIVDCQENPLVNFHDMHFYEQHHWILEENSFLSTNLVLTSTALWSRVTQEQRAVILKAVRESTIWQWNNARMHNERCRQSLMQKHGVRLYQPTPGEQALWLQAAEQFRADFPHQDLLEMIAAARKEEDHGFSLSAAL